MITTTAIDELVSSLGHRETALAELFSIYREPLSRSVDLRLDRRLAGRVDRDDVLQETYLAARDRLQHFLDAKDLSILAWLRMVLLQTVVDVHRRHLGAKKRRVDLEVSLSRRRSAQATSVSIAAGLASSWTTPTQAVLRAELSRQMARVLDSMAPLDREVLVLRHLEGLRNNEVAEVLGIHKAAATNRYLRALKRLKTLLVETHDPS